MKELIIPNSSSRPTTSGSIDDNMECLGNQLAMVKSEMVNQTVADGYNHSVQQEKTSPNQSDCDKPVKTENELNAVISIVDEVKCEKDANMDDNRTADAKQPPNGTRSKLIYSCHRCKLIFSSRISFESHYK